MNTTTTDTFENIAGDAVDLLLSIIQDLIESDDPADNIAALVIAAQAESFCFRAVALVAAE